MKESASDSRGFTVIELLVVILVLTTLSVIAIANIRSLRAQNRDTASKTDVNAIYYQLESFHERSGYYPEALSTETLKGLDPESLKDNLGKSVNEANGMYTYKPTSCSEGKCKSFELSAQLEKEAPYVKQSLN